MQDMPANIENHQSIQNPSKEMIMSAKSIQKIFLDGFQWSDIPNLINICLGQLSHFENLSLNDQKKKLTDVLNYVIDTTDTPLLPDAYTDDLFKAMVPPMIETVLKAKAGALPMVTNPTQKPTPQTFKSYALEVKKEFTDGFQWSDIATVMQSTLSFVGGFHELDIEQKKLSAKQILDFIIDETDTPFLPDFFFDPIFKELSHPIVDLAFSYLKDSK